MIRDLGLLLVVLALSIVNDFLDLITRSPRDTRINCYEDWVVWRE